jgi:hypothetical protein
MTQTSLKMTATSEFLSDVCGIAKSCSPALTQTAGKLSSDTDSIKQILNFEILTDGLKV